jgi:hypothetical protein
MGYPRKNDIVIPKVGVDGTFKVKSNAGAFFENPFRTSKHVAMIDEEDVLSVILRSPKENSLTVVLMICPNIKEVHP